MLCLLASMAQNGPMSPLSLGTGELAQIELVVFGARELTIPTGPRSVGLRPLIGKLGTLPIQLIYNYAWKA